MESWQDLLGPQQAESPQEFGPHTAWVRTVVAVLSNTEWLTKVGETIDEPSIVQVHSWDEAFAEFERDASHYDSAGHLLRPVELCQNSVSAGSLHQWWEHAIIFSYDYYTTEGYLPDFAEDWKTDWLSNYLYQYISSLLAEIVAADTIECTYFRELLPWFYSGHFPCGWIGSWPQGRLRVF